MTFTPHDITAMQLAIAASERAIQTGDLPFGATLVGASGDTLLVAANTQNSTNDCTAHAEMVLVREAQKTLGLTAIQGATVYASGEPCAMCSGAMFWAGISRIVFAASQTDIAEALGSNPVLPITSSHTLANSVPGVNVAGPLLSGEAKAVLMRFASKSLI